MRIAHAFAVLLLTEAALLAQGTIPGLTSTPITFSGHADDFVAGPDGNVWLVDSAANAIGRLAVDGSAYQAFPVPTASAGLNSITLGPDGNLWFTESTASKVGRITAPGVITEFPMPPGFVFTLFGFVNGLGTITAGPDGNLWISNGPQMARVTSQGTVTLFSVSPPPGGDLLQVGKCVSGPDGNLWCLSSVRIAGEFDNHPAKVTTAGIATLYPGFFGQYFDIVSAPDGNLWISAQGASPPESLTRVTPAGVETVYTLPTTRESRLAVGADGNIWFTERTTMGNLWQMILASATDDGHATFNSAPITTSYPEGIIAVSSPAAAGIRNEQTQPTGCPPGVELEIITPVDYGANVTRVKTSSPDTCTDLYAFASQFASRGDVAGTFKSFAGCGDDPASPNPALDIVLAVKLPPGSAIDSMDANGADIDKFGCSIQDSGGLAPAMQCTAPAIAQGKTRTVHFTGNLTEGRVTALCGSSTPDTNPGNNGARGYVSHYPPRPTSQTVSVPDGRGQ